MRLIDVVNAPWAIVPDRLKEIKAIYETHLKGEKIDLKPVEAALGRPLDNRSQGYEVTDGVAVIPIEGVIAKRMNLFTQISGGTSTELLIRDLKSAIDDPDVRAIVLSIDSPGGVVDGTADLAELIYGSRGTKPIFAFTNGMMCSAAYWIGSAAERVYISNNTTAVGSIGVVATHTDVSKLEEKSGVKTTEVYAGRYKRIASQYAPLSDEGRQSIQERVDYIYSVFISAVAGHRGVSIEKALEMADGRIFSGKQAIEAGLVDGISTLDDLIDSLKSGGGPDRKKANSLSQEGIMASEDKKAAEAVTITAEFLSEKHPEIHKAIRDEGYKAGLAEGALAERERIQGVFSTFRTGREKLVAEIMFDGKSTKADASVAILEAEDARRDALRAALKEDGKDIAVDQADPGIGGEVKPLDFESLVKAHMDEKGCGRAEAISAVAKAHPEAHERYIAAQNRK